MKEDVTNRIYRKAFGVEFNQKYVNKNVKAVVINFGDDRGDIIVTNDNYGTNHKNPDFTEGKKAAGLNPLQIVFTDLETAMICHDRYIGSDDKMHVFGEGEEVL